MKIIQKLFGKKVKGSYKTEEKGLEEVLAMAGSDEMKTKMLDYFLECTKDRYGLHLNRIVETYEKAGQFEKAAKALEYSEPDRAIELYAKSGEFRQAISLAEEHKQDEKARDLYMRFMEVEESKGGLRHLMEAENIAERLGLIEKAKEILKKRNTIWISDYEKEGRLEDAAKCAEEAGLSERAKRLYSKVLEDYEKKECYENAAGIAGKLGLFEKEKELCLKALESYEMKGWYDEAAKIAEKLSLVEKSKEIYAKIMRQSESEGRYEEAAKIAVEKLGLSEKAKQLYLKAIDSYEEKGMQEHVTKDTGMYEHAARIAEQHELFERAILLYEKAAEKAIEHYDKHGERGRLFWEAGEIAEKRGLAEKAKGLYEKSIEDKEKSSSTHQVAEKAQQKLGVERALLVYERNCKFKNALELAEEYGLLEKAELYQAIIALPRKCLEDEKLPQDLIDYILKPVSGWKHF